MAATSNEFLVAKARCAEVELMNAHLKDEVQSLKVQKADLEDQLKAQTQRLASQASNHFQEELFASQKEVLRLTDHKASLEQQLEKANETVQQLHKNIAREVQKAKDEVERQSIFLRSQILEQKEINTSLQEKLMTALQVSKQLDDQGMHDNVTESILITSDAVLQKFRHEHRSSVKGKYDVNVDINGRNMVLSGRRVNVQLLKAEIMTALNEAYCALVDPTKYVSAAKAKEEASKHEIDHLRRTVLTHETTIQSLHVALQHAQDGLNNAVRVSEDATRKCAVLETQQREQAKLRAKQVSDFEEQIRSLTRQLGEQEETNRMALQSLKAESEIAAQHRNQIDELQEEMKRLSDVKELAERSVYVTTRQLEMTREQLQDAVRSDVNIADLNRRLENAEHQAQTVEQRVSAARREAKTHEQRLTIEIGTLQERLRQCMEEVHHAKRDLQTASLERDSARAELQQSRDIIHEMRNKMVHLSVVSMNDHQREASPSSFAHKERSPMESILLGGEKQLTRLEEENGALRTELQHAFEDMRAVATSLKETRIIRERALEDVQRLESEKTRLFEERQKMERQSIEDRMASRQRESELELQVLALRDELQHQQKRVDMLHVEYQRKIQDLMQDSAQRMHTSATGGDEYAEHEQNAYNRMGKGGLASSPSSTKRTPRSNEAVPNDASQVPQRTPKFAAANTRPSGATPVFTLRSASNDVHQTSGLVSTPRTQQPGATPSSGFRLPSTGRAHSALESPPL